MAELGGDVSDVSDESSAPQRDEFAPVRWLFIDGDRLLVSLLLIAVTYVLLVGAGAVFGPISTEEVTPLFYLFSALTGGNFTLVTIVISVSQLVISRQLGTPHSIRQEIESTNEYRQRIEEQSDVDVAPVRPTAFLHLLLESTADHTRTLTRESEGHTGEAWDELRAVVDRLSGHVGAVEGKLARSDVSVVSGLAVTLDTNYSVDIRDIRKLRAEYEDEYTEPVRACLDDVLDDLQQVDVGRQYLKTLYMQDELSRLSRILLYVGIPAIVTSILALRSFAVGVETVSPVAQFLVVPAAVVISLAPLLVMFAYILRITTVARRTLAITPFTMATSDRDRNLLFDE